MGEKEDKEKAEKLAAAKKRVAQLQKKKKAAAGDGAETSKGAGAKAKQKTKNDGAEKDKKASAEEETGDPDNDAGDEDDVKDKTAEASEEPDVQTKHELDLDEETDTSNEVNKGSMDPTESEPDSTNAPDAQTVSPSSTDATSQPPSARKHPNRQPSISQQSQIRSTSFRQGSGPASLGDSIEQDESLYRKQTARIEELEKENRRLNEVETKFHKVEAELEEFREKAAEQVNQGQDDELQKLQEEVATLRRNARKSISAGTTKERQGSATEDSAEGYRKELEGKDSTISDLQLEISRLRAEVSNHSKGDESHDEQVSALQTSLAKAEASIKQLQSEVGDTKKLLTRASEKAVQEGSHKTSQETKIRSLERDLESLRSDKDEADKKSDGLDKKIEAMNKLHREAEQRSSQKLTTAETEAREAQVLRAKVESLQKDNTRLREAARKHHMSGGGDDDGLDELEDEERRKMEHRIRDLESEVFELRRGVWRDRRKDMQSGMEDDNADDFDDVDLSGSGALSRRRSTTSGGFMPGGTSRQHSNFTQVISSGLAAFTGPNHNSTGPATSGRPRNDSLLQELDDDDMAFDEAAFAHAQREEEMKKMVEHVREVKKGLKKWVGWRLDLVDSRKGGGGIGAGEIFEV